MIGLGDGDIAGQIVVGHAAIGAALDVGVAAQRVQPAAGASDVAQQQLQHRREVDQLHRVAVMRPTQGVHDRSCAVGRIGRGDDLGRFEEIFRPTAADARYHFGRVARVELLHELEHAAWVLHGGIDFGKTSPVQLVIPGGLVVALLLRVPAGEQPFRFVERVAFPDQKGSVGIETYVFFANAVVGEDVVDQPRQERYVGAGSNLREVIGDRSGALEARVNRNELGVAIALGLHDEAEPDRVVLRRVASHGQDDIGVGNVGPAVGHGPAPECGGQTGHRRAMSYTGLLFQGNDAQPGAEGFYQQVVILIGVGAAADDTHGSQRV